MDMKKKVGTRLKAARDAVKLTLEQVCARGPGLLVSRLGNWEQGTRMIPNEFAQKLAPIYGVRAAWLVYLEEEDGSDIKKQKLDDLYSQIDVRITPGRLP